MGFKLTLSTDASDTSATDRSLTTVAHYHISILEFGLFLFALKDVKSLIILGRD